VISPAALFNGQVEVATVNGRAKSMAAFVAGPLAVALHRGADRDTWVVIHIASGCEIEAAAADDGMRALLHMGALLALPIDWKSPAPFTAGMRRMCEATLATLRGAL
jgi:hypothetical protein